MTQTAVKAFDRTMQTTGVWLHEIQESLGLQNRQHAYQALRVVLHTLRDRLSAEQAVALGAQLPMLVRGFYYEGWHLKGTPGKERKKEDFLSPIARIFYKVPEINAEAVARAVFGVMARHVSPGEIEHVKITLPGEIRSLWPEEMHSLWF